VVYSLSGDAEILVLHNWPNEISLSSWLELCQKLLLKLKLKLNLFAWGEIQEGTSRLKTRRRTGRAVNFRVAYKLAPTIDVNTTLANVACANLGSRHPTEEWKFYSEFSRAREYFKPSSVSVCFDKELLGDVKMLDVLLLAYQVFRPAYGYILDCQGGQLAQGFAHGIPVPALDPDLCSDERLSETSLVNWQLNRKRLVDEPHFLRDVFSVNLLTKTQVFAKFLYRNEAKTIATLGIGELYNVPESNEAYIWKLDDEDVWRSRDILKRAGRLLAADVDSMNEVSE